MNLCLDLFAGLGGFSKAFQDSGDWEVVTVDMEEEFEPDIQADVMQLSPSDFERDFDLVLAGPPCTRLGKMAQMQGYFDGLEPQTEGARDHIALVYHTIGLIRGLNPDYWFLENPQGKLPKIIGPPTGTVTYCQYGESYQKRTHLWGDHPPMDYRSCVEGEDCHTSTPRSDDRHPNDTGWGSQAERAKVPRELSEAILEAVEGRSEQQSLTEATAQ